MSNESDLKPLSGENILYETHPSMVRNRPGWYAIIIASILLGLALFIYSFTTELLTWKWGGILFGLFSGLGVLAYFIWWLRCKATTLTVTNERTTLRRGILSKALSEVWHQDVRNVTLNQSFMQRVLDVGTLGVSSAAQSGLEIEVHGIPDPDRVKQLIDEHRRR